MKMSVMIAEVKARMPDVEDPRVAHVTAAGGYFLCTWKGSARCVYFAAPNPQVAAMAGKTAEAWAADSIVNDLRHE